MRESPRRQDLRRGDRLRPVRRRLPHHRTRPRAMTVRFRAHAGRVPQRRAHPVRRAIRQRARHLDADGRRSRARGGGALLLRRRTPAASRCRPPNPPPGTCWGPPARSRRSSRSWRSATASHPPTLNLEKPSRDSVIDPGGQGRPGTPHRHRAVQQLRLRRHQRQHPVQPGGLIVPQVFDGPSPGCRLSFLDRSRRRRQAAAP